MKHYHALRAKNTEVVDFLMFSHHRVTENTEIVIFPSLGDDQV